MLEFCAIDLEQQVCLCMCLHYIHISMHRCIGAYTYMYILHICV